MQQPPLELDDNGASFDHIDAFPLPMPPADTQADTANLHQL